MRSQRCAAFLIPFCALVATLSAVADELPETVEAGSTTLQKLGEGLRRAKWVGFKVYRAALYAPQAAPPEALLTNEQPKQLRLLFLRDVPEDEIHEDLEEGFQAPAMAGAAKEQEQRAKLAELKDAFSDLEAGAEVILTFDAAGLTLQVDGRQRARLEGRDFAAGVLAIWIGPDAAFPELRESLLGRS